MVQLSVVLQFVNVIAIQAIGKNKRSQDDVELLLLLTVNKLENKMHLNDVTFDDVDDLPDLEHEVESKTNQIASQSLTRKQELQSEIWLKFYQEKQSFSTKHIHMCEF